MNEGSWLCLVQGAGFDKRFEEDKLFYYEDVRFYLQKLLKNFCQELFTC